MDINKLRQLIRTGEYLEEHLSDDAVRSQWIFDVEDFISILDKRQQMRVTSPIFKLKSFSSSLHRDLNRNRRENLNLVLGFLRSLYNNDTSINKPIVGNSQAVFIVHGHDDTLIDEVKSCVTSLGLKPIVLREQTDNGNTIIEKLEDWLGNCKCAVILYTPCDVGKSVRDEVDEKRARQNVVYEHGLFQGYLGRKRIIVLKKGETTLPGDCSGVVYTTVDDTGWQEQLKNNIKATDLAR